MSASDDEWEETTMVVQLNGVLDAQSVRDAVSKGQVTLRRGHTDTPIMQVGNALYTGKWERNAGSDIILQAEAGEQVKIISVSDRVLRTEKALLTQQESAAKKTV